MHPISSHQTCLAREQASASTGNSSFSSAVDSIFLKNPSRIQALMAVMCLCLMVYGFAQYTIRSTLEKAKETLPNQNWTKRHKILPCSGSTACSMAFTY